jgi:hypothetical protein
MQSDCEHATQSWRPIGNATKLARGHQRLDGVLEIKTAAHVENSRSTLPRYPRPAVSQTQASSASANIFNVASNC